MNQSKGKDAFADRLAKSQAGWNAAQKQADVAGGDEKFPEGEYIAKVTAKLRDAKSGNLMVNRMFVPTEGEMTGVAMFDNLVIDQPNASSAMRARRDTLRFLNLCGYKFGSVSDLPDVLEELSKEAPLVKINVRHSGDFVNVDVLEYLGASNGAAAESAPNTPSEEPPAGEDLTAQLNEFLAAYGLDEGADEEDAKATITANAPFKGEELTKEERELLTKAGLTDVIQEPPKAPPVRKAPPVKKEAAPVRKAPAGKPATRRK